MLLYQDNYNGGITSDGISYIDFDYLQKDTINFQTYIPTGSTVKKAFLLGLKGLYEFGSNPTKDVALNCEFNSNAITLDSSNNIGNEFYSSGLKHWIISKDVTTFITTTNNELIIPCQGCQITIGSEAIVYRTFLLIIFYQNNSYPLINTSVYVTNNDYFIPTVTQQFNGLNPINTTNDVGLSIWSGNTCSTQPFHTSLNYALQSSLGTFNLGTLDAAIGNNNCKESIVGSFYYDNSTLNGLVDDTPDTFIDSTDALVNIKNYLPSFATTFSLISNGGFAAGGSYRVGEILAYTTPCPASTSKDTSITICRGQNVQLSASTGFTNYNWYPLAGLNDSSIANPIANPLQSTNYIAYVKDVAGCMHSEHTQIIVHGSPVPDTITTANAVCGGNGGKLNITTNYYHNYSPYTYNIGAGNSNDTSFTNLSQGNYTLTITDNAGCTFQSNFIINEVNPVNAGFGTLSATSSNIAPLYVSFVNNTIGATNYTWYLPTTTANTYNTNYTFADAGTYTVTLIAYNNLQQCADTTTKIIIVLPQDTAGIFIPNVFSPNGDEINDLFEVKIKNASVELFEIYDRWGVVVFKSEIKNISSETIYWEGRTISGMECSDGTYFYVIQIKLDEKYSKEKTKEYKGFITLVR